jgi:hypothetical protein
VAFNQWLSDQVARGFTVELGVDASMVLYAFIGDAGETALKLCATAMVVDTPQAWAAAAAALFFGGSGIFSQFCHGFPAAGVKVTFHFEAPSRQSVIKQAARADRLKKMEPALLALDAAQGRLAAGDFSARTALHTRLADVAALTCVPAKKAGWLCARF